MIRSVFLKNHSGYISRGGSEEEKIENKDQLEGATIMQRDDGNWKEVNGSKDTISGQI